MRSHDVICQELGAAYQELAAIEQVDLQARVRAWDACTESSATAREQYVRAVTVSSASDVIELKGGIRALEYELRACEWQATHAD